VTSQIIFNAVNVLMDDIHRANVQVGWWDNISVEDANVVPAKLALVHSEISEALEGHRKGLMDDKLPHRSMIEVELADAVIRILDLAGALGLNLGGAICEKLEYNATRADHKRENRELVGGKKY
jgi:hypothetical protein